MEFHVTNSSGSLIAPCEPTPLETLDLSRIDKLPVLRCNARTLHVFEPIGPCGAAGSTIREALAKALVPYYPLAGRLSKDGSTIECTGDGVWFVESSANCSLRSVGYFEDVTTIPSDSLLPSPPPEDQNVDPLVLMQITEFEEDGFVMGLTFCHTICDGLGAAQFLNAIGEFARKVNPLTATPVWHRDFLPPQLPTPTTLPPPNFTLPDYRLVQANIDISLDNHITRLKHEFSKESLKHCSTFEIVAAVLWRNRTQTIITGSESKVMKLVFFANCRPLVVPPLPKGFYGNCFFPVTISASSETLARASINEVIKMIQEAKARLPEEFSDWVSLPENGRKKEDPFAPPLGYDTLFLSEWGRLGFNEVDYGNGPPVHVVPLQGSPVIPVAIVGSLPRPNKGVRLMTWCVEDQHLLPFLNSVASIFPR